VLVYAIGKPPAPAPLVLALLLDLAAVCSLADLSWLTSASCALCIALRRHCRAFEPTLGFIPTLPLPLDAVLLGRDIGMCIHVGGRHFISACASGCLCAYTCVQVYACACIGAFNVKIGYGGSSSNCERPLWFEHPGLISRTGIGPRVLRVGLVTSASASRSRCV